MLLVSVFSIQASTQFSCLCHVSQFCRSCCSQWVWVVPYVVIDEGGLVAGVSAVYVMSVSQVLAVVVNGYGLLHNCWLSLVALYIIHVDEKV